MRPPRSDERIFGVALDEKALGGEASPHVVVLELGDEFARRGAREVDRFGGQTAFWSEAIDASAVVARADVLVLAHFFGDVIGMFDDVALHIDHVERAVGAKLEANEASGAVGAGDEFARGF